MTERSETRAKPRRAGEKELVLRLTLRANKLRCADAGMTCDALSDDQQRSILAKGSPGTCKDISMDTKLQQTAQKPPMLVAMH